jgi:hypothetical protein
MLDVNHVPERCVKGAIGGHVFDYHEFKEALCSKWADQSMFFDFLDCTSRLMTTRARYAELRSCTRTLKRTKPVAPVIWNMLTT